MICTISRGYFGNPAMKFRRLSSQAAGVLTASCGVVAFLVASVERLLMSDFAKYFDFWKEWSSDFSGCCINKVWVVCSTMSLTIQYVHTEFLRNIYLPLADTPKVWIDLDIAWTGALYKPICTIFCVDNDLLNLRVNLPTNKIFLNRNSNFQQKNKQNKNKKTSSRKLSTPQPWFLWPSCFFL